MPALSDREIERFGDEGYLLVEDVIDPERYLDPMVDEYQGLLDRLGDRLYREGRIPSTYADLPFGRRLTQIYRDTGEVWDKYFDFSLPFKDVQPDQPCHFGPAVFEVLRCPQLMDAVESLIGPEIYSNPVQHVRLKPPERLTPRDPESGRVLLGATPWHQDNGVVIEEADETEMLTVWIPVFDATEEHGCLRVVPRNHRAGLLHHCTGTSGYYLPETEFDLDRAAAVPMRRGSALFMHRRTPHSSLSNLSDDVRWSMDLRYNPTGQPTGRPEFPGFVARSRSNPASELRDPAEWERLWMVTRERMSSHPELVGAFGRWQTGDPYCA